MRVLHSFALGAFHMQLGKVMCTGTVVVGHTCTHTHKSNKEVMSGAEGHISDV